MTVPALTSIQIDFNQAVAGVQAADLLVNGVAATNMVSYTPWLYMFFFAQPVAGLVQVSWAAGQDIHDQATNHFAGGNWVYTLSPLATPTSLMLTEFMAANKDTLLDVDGSSSDWIEIFNPTAGSISLTGWSLTSQATNLTEWRFPNYTLLAKNFLVVFASGKNRTNVTGQLHTNFKLSAAGGFLGLVDSRTNLVSFFGPAYPPQPSDVAYGRDPVQLSQTGFFTVPTPGKRNAVTGPGFAPAVQFSRTGGTFLTAFSLRLDCSASGAVMRYTLDGKLPTDISLAYIGPLSIANSVQVRARAFVPGLMPGPLHSESYLLLNANLVNTNSDLPAVVIHNFAAGAVPTSPSQLVNMSFYEPINGKTWLTNAPKLSFRAGLHRRGSSTLGLAKQSWTVTFWDDFNGNADFAPLGLPAGSHWVLYAPNNFEPVLIHNPLMYRLSNEIGRYASRTRFVEVYLNTSGGAVSAANYNGIYVLEEKIEHGNDRVAIDQLQPEDNTAPAITGGYLMKIDRLAAGASGFSAAGQSIVYVDPTETNIKTPQRAPQKLYLQNYMNSFGTALNGVNFKSPTLGYAAYIDVDSWIDHHILNVVAFNVDALRLSTYFYKPRNGKLVFGPIWDFDRSQGSTDGRDINPKVWSGGTDFFNYPWWSKMFTDLDFWQKWIDRYQDLRAGTLSTNHIFAVIDQLANEVRKAQPREAARWAGFTTPRSGTVSGYRLPGTYQGEVDFLKLWYNDRLNFIDGKLPFYTNLLARPVASPNGGPISPGVSMSLSGPAGATLYYCTDGSDPRLPGGAISSKARAYSAPVPLSQSVMITARAYNASHRNLTGGGNPPTSSPWSGLTTVTFGYLTSPDAIAYNAEGQVYAQNFDALPNPGQTSVDADNPVAINGALYALANPFGFARPVRSPGGAGGLGLVNTLPGWHGWTALKAKIGANTGDQSTGGLISFGLTNSPAAGANRALGLLATSSTGPTAFGVRFINATGHTLNQMNLHCRGELWRQAPIPKTLAFSYYIDLNSSNIFSTNITAAITSLNVQFPAWPSAASPLAVDGTLPANQVSLGVDNQAIADWPPGAALWLVWRMTDPAAKGQGLAIDDLTFSAAAAPVKLAVQSSSAGTVIAWPAGYGEYVLEGSATLGLSTQWTPAKLPMITTDGFNRVIVHGVTGSQFYRLRRGYSVAP